jgi:hypothetical protein
MFCEILRNNQRQGGRQTNIQKLGFLNNGKEKEKQDPWHNNIWEN